MSALAAAQRRNRSMYSRVAMFAPMDETSGTSTAAQRRKRVRGKVAGIFTKRLEEDQLIDSLSSFYVPRLANQVTTHGSWINTSSFVVPMYEARWDTPKIHVSDDPPGSQMDLDDSPYKWGSGADRPWEPGYRSSDAEELMFSEGGGQYFDRSMLVLDSTNDAADEYFSVYRAGADRISNPHGWPNVTATFGGHMPNLSQFNGIWPSGPGGTTGFGLSGTSVAYSVTIVRLEELQAGVIPHAIPFAVSVGTSQHRLPATRGDQSGGTDDVPEGARFRLPYDHSVDAWAVGHELCPLSRMFIVTARDFGLVVSDASSGTVSFSVEDHRRPPGYLTDTSVWLPFLTSERLVSFTGTASNNTITAFGHSIQNSHKRRVRVIDKTGGSGLDTNVYYYVGSCTTNTFQLFTNFSQTVLASLGSDVTGHYSRLLESYELFDSSRFPWSSLLLLPPQAAF